MDASNQHNSNTEKSFYLTTSACNTSYIVTALRRRSRGKGSCSEDLPVPPAVMILHNKKSRACAVVVRVTRSVESPSSFLYGGIIKVEIFSVSFFFDERKPSSHPEEQ